MFTQFDHSDMAIAEANTKANRTFGQKLAIGLTVLAVLVYVSLFLLRIFGLLVPFSVPTGAMSPTIDPGDHVLMQRFSYLWRKPRRGDVVVFKTDGLPMVSQGQAYVKRITGLPGERVSFADGNLFINGKQVTVKNGQGQIRYQWPPESSFVQQHTNEISVPIGSYFVNGDNTTNSLDSRYFGPIAADKIMGKIALRYWPLTKIGLIK